MATSTDIIDLLGGAAVLSRETGFPLTTIASWGDANFIPEWRRETLLTLAKSKGKKLKPSDFPTADQRISRAKPAEQEARAA